MADWGTTTWYEKFKDFQSLLGFGGVILTLWWNAKLKRDEHKRVVDHQRTTLLAALRAELNASRKHYLTSLISLRDAGDDKAIIFCEPPRQVFDRSIEKLGLLTSEQTEGLIHTYQLLTTVPQIMRDENLLAIRARDGAAALPDEGANGAILFLDPAYNGDAKRYLEDGLRRLEKIISILS